MFNPFGTDREDNVSWEWVLAWQQKELTSYVSGGLVFRGKYKCHHCKSKENQYLIEEIKPSQLYERAITPGTAACISRGMLKSVLQPGLEAVGQAQDAQQGQSAALGSGSAGCKCPLPS